MKKLLILIIVLVAGTITTFAQSAKDTLPKGKTDTAFKMEYTCGMHPEITSDKPGRCPKCGMDLVKKKDSAMQGMKMDSMKPIPDPSENQVIIFRELKRTI